MRQHYVATRAALGLLIVHMLAACSSGLVSSWAAPDITPFPMHGVKVAAVVMTTHESARRDAEDALAHQLALRGAEGVPMYTIFPDINPGDEAEARAAAERAGIEGVVVMRPVSVDQEISSTPYSGGYWGGYYGHGWGSPWGYSSVSGGQIRTRTVVTVETLVFKLSENRLVWAGMSKSTDPSDVDRLIETTARQVAKELERMGLLAKE